MFSARIPFRAPPEPSRIITRTCITYCGLHNDRHNRFGKRDLPVFQGREMPPRDVQNANLIFLPSPLQISPLFGNFLRKSVVPVQVATCRSTKGKRENWSTPAATSDATPACSGTRSARCVRRTVSATSKNGENSGSDGDVKQTSEMLLNRICRFSA